jgi:hypothetical protein
MDYYWLFDREMRFSKRMGFCLKDELEVTDYLKMRNINRKNLTKFLKRIRRNSKIECPIDIESFDSQSTDKDYSSGRNSMPED